MTGTTRTNFYKMYDSVIPSMQNTPCKLAVYIGDNGEIKVFEKVYFKNTNPTNWFRNVCSKSIKQIEKCVEQNNALAVRNM